MKRKAVTGALCALITIAAGCSEDVGDCFQGGARGLDTVLNGGHVEYGGQAILNNACATGCHSSSATGKARNGAPAGLDFDLRPVAASSATESAENDNGRSYAVLDRDTINGLRERQRKVFSERNLIWQQVRDGLMPPDGMFESFKRAVTQIIDTDEASPCTRGAAFGDIDSKQAQDVLRNWLACQAPIVESYGGPTEVNGTAGQAGYQYLSCSGTQQPGDGGAGDAGDGGGGEPSGPSFDTIYEDILAGTGNCALCHPGVNDSVDLTDVDTAFADLVEDTAAKCGTKPYVTPGEPENSYLIDLVTLTQPCPSKTDVSRMPDGLQAMSEDDVQVLRDWITAGATRNASLVRNPALKGGFDAGVR
jgi:hypothetical protein